MAKFIYWLPDTQGAKVEHETDANSVIIIGANGSGKTSLAAWIEKQDFEKVHRIAAQRDLNFSENIPLKSFSQAQEFVFYGSDNKNHHTSKGYRWNWGQYTTRLIQDFEYVLAALLAKYNNESHDYCEKAKLAEQENKDKPLVPENCIDKLQKIWTEIFPHRDLIVKDSKFYAVLKNNEQEEEYCANQMSDGERAVLYLAAQVLCVEQNKILLIDEPEIHLHRSLVERIWTALERLRPDCLFIYITHDTDFATMHGNSDKIWVQEYDGKSWTLEILPKDELPQDLLLEVLGNRKNILFVEGEKNSYDTQLYSILYKDYYVIPCGSCEQVILKTKAFRKNQDLHNLQVYGLIDRDFRSDYEIETYKKDGIYVLGVAEVENLFIVEELIRAIAEHMAQNPDECFAKVRDYVINTRFRQQLQGQICESVKKEIKYQLSVFEIAGKDDSQINNCLGELQKTIDVKTIYGDKTKFYDDILKSGDYSNVLRFFNAKSLAKCIGKNSLGIDDGKYCKIVLDLLRDGRKPELLNAFDKYLPLEIQR